MKQSRTKEEAACAWLWWCAQDKTPTKITNSPNKQASKTSDANRDTTSEPLNKEKIELLHQQITVGSPLCNNILDYTVLHLSDYIRHNKYFPKKRERGGAVQRDSVGRR